VATGAQNGPFALREELEAERGWGKPPATLRPRRKRAGQLLQAL